MLKVYEEREGNCGEYIISEINLHDFDKISVPAHYFYKFYLADANSGRNYYGSSKDMRCNGVLSDTGFGFIHLWPFSGPCSPFMFYRSIFWERVGMPDNSKMGVALVNGIYTNSVQRARLRRALGV